MLQVDEQEAEWASTYIAPGPVKEPRRKRSRWLILGALFVTLTLLLASASLLNSAVSSPLTAPSHLTPSGSTITERTPDLSWTSVKDADMYRVQLSTDADFSKVIIDEYTFAPYLKLSRILEADSSYYWRVASIRSSEVSAWNATSFFIGISSFQRDYSWDYNGRTWSLSLTISGEEYYEARDERRWTSYYSYVTPNSQAVVSLASKLNNLATNAGYGSLATANLILSFVQSIPYVEDISTAGVSEYPRYSVETLVDGGGDCEDKAALFISLIESPPISGDAVLLVFTGHAAAAVNIPHYLSSAHYYQYDSNEYYFCETTAPSWAVGEMPAELQGSQCRIYGTTYWASN